MQPYLDVGPTIKCLEINALKCQCIFNEIIKFVRIHYIFMKCFLTTR